MDTNNTPQVDIQGPITHTRARQLNLQVISFLRNYSYAYGVGFGCSLYGWKDNFKKLPMAPVSGPNSSGVDRNHLHKLTSRICSGAGTPSFGLLGRVSCQGPFWVCPRGLA
jgi:hypothetical protein